MDIPEDGHKNVRKIINPYVNNEGYNCFGCSPDNKLGLQLEFTEEGDYLVSHWIPKNHYAGYQSMLHGGIQATLMDEIGSWIVQVKLNTAGVTAKLEVRYIKSISVKEKVLKLKARIVKHVRNLAYVETELRNEKDEVCSTANLVFFLFPKEKAKSDFSYSGSESFFAKP
jgi:uncharacterized protein (TIGR00369 family)